MNLEDDTSELWEGPSGPPPAKAAALPDRPLDDWGDLPLPLPFAWVRVLIPLQFTLRHLGALGALAMAWLGLVGPLEWAMLGVGYLVTMLGITAGYHRHFAHRAFEAHPALRLALGLAGSMAGQGPVTFWVGTHRHHHQVSDQVGDPHSPRVLAGPATPWARAQAYWHGHMGWFLGARIRGWGPYVPDLLQDPLVLWLHRHGDAFAHLGLLLPGAVGAWVHGSWQGALAGVLVGGCLRMVLVEHVVYLVNGWGHLGRSRPFPTRDHSANVPLLGLLALGDGWHNNHHAFPASARHGLLPGQVDLAHLAIRTWVALGWAWRPIELPEALIQAKLRAKAPEA
jgi:stearoyl-CoA desaturase (delta-9 desaturase)